MSRLTDLTESLLEVPLAEPPSISTLSQRADRRRVEHRRRGFAFAAIAVMGVAIIGTAFEQTVGAHSSTPLLSAQVTAFTDPGPPHPLNGEVSLGPQLSGWKLISDRQTNISSTPANYSRSITYENDSTGSGKLFTITINQGTVNPDFTTPPPGGIANATIRQVTVDGNRALLMQISNEISYTPVKGPNGTRSITLSGACTDATATNSMASTSVSPCNGITQSSRKDPNTILQWQLSPILGVQLVGFNLSPTEIQAIASALVINPALDDCMPGGTPIHSGQCAPGIIASPPITTPQVPIGGTELAYGTAKNQPWVFSASVSSSNSWMEVVYGNAVVTSSGSTKPMATVNWDNASNGETFLSGTVPSWVTSVSVAGPSNQTTALLPTTLDGWRYFILPMGVATAPCNGVCSEPITVTFYHGSTMVGHASMATTETSYGGFKLSQPT